VKGCVSVSDKKLDLIISEIHKMHDETNKRFEQNEAMISTLIKMAGTTNAKLEELSADLKDTNGTLHLFRSETDVHFKKLDRRVKLIESDLDETMVKVSEITLPRN
jgi:hypothetical protein